MTLRILGISLDYTLAQPRDQTIGDAHDRQLKYAALLDRLTYVVYTPRSLSSSPPALAPNLAVYPTRPRTRALFVLDALRTASTIARTQAFDLVTTQDPFATAMVAYVLRQRLGLPFSVALFSSFFDNPTWRGQRRVNRWLEPLGRYLVRRADTVRVESAVECDKLIELGVPKERIWIVPFLVDLRRFVASKSRRRAAPSDRTVLFAGRLAPEKDLPTLLRAMVIVQDRCPGTRLVIVGDGPQRQRVKELAGNLGLQGVDLTGVVSPEELPGYFAACDVFVLPSVYEGVPRVLVEAGAAGKPVVATRTRNVTDVVTDGVTGFIVSIGDHVAMAERIVELLRRPDMRDAMGTAARTQVLARFDEGRILEDLVAMWRATAHRGGRDG
jgi:glycosyltransferase involved in cell wall biosynthesis